MSEAQEERPVVWTGHLERGDAPGTVRGEIQDSWGWVVYLTGTLRPEGGYRLEGRLGPVPPALAVPIIDDPITPSG